MKPLCQVTLKDLMDLLEEVQLADESKQPGERQPAGGTTKRRWLTLEEIAERLNLDQEILRFYLEDGEPEGRSLPQGYYRRIERTM